MADIKAALSAEDWALANIWVKEGNWQAIEETFDICDDHARAAIHLHGQPFGFSWEDVDAIRDFTAEPMSKEYGRGGPTARQLDSVADRIAALLPPRQTRAAEASALAALDLRRCNV